MRCGIDHLVVTAPSLQGGGDHVKSILGIAPGPGGAHPRMGTHNLLLRLGESAFLEVIAPDPAAPHPGRPRWFGLDDAATLRIPRLAAWVARTDDVGACPPEVLADCGAVETMTRGTREWRITIPADGRRGAWSEPQAMVLRPTPRAPLGQVSPDGSAIELRWGGRAEDRVEAELASDEAFQQVAVRGDFATPGARLARPTAGTYFARYRYVEPDGFRTAWSAPVKIEVEGSWHRALRALLPESWLK